MRNWCHALSIGVIGLFLTASIQQAAGEAPKPTANPLPTKLGDTCDNSIGMTFAFIPGGTFTMGSPPAEGGRFNNEPQYGVTISHSFLMGTTDVTVAQFSAFVKDSGYKTDAEKQGWAVALNGQKFIKTNGASWRNPGFTQGQDHPVVEVSWNDAVAFNAWLSRKEGKRYRLATEAEWEYACRAGTTTTFLWGDWNNNGLQWANGPDQSIKKSLPSFRANTFNWDDGYPFTSPVGKFKANAWGLKDMSGNVWEWCSDFAGNYPQQAMTDPKGPSAVDAPAESNPLLQYRGPNHIIRGGAFDSLPRTLRPACRGGAAPGLTLYDLGFRTVMEMDGPAIANAPAPKAQKPDAQNPPADAAKPAIDPAAVGTWCAELKFNNKPVVMTMTIAADGHYVQKLSIGGMAREETGQALFTNGKCVLRSDAGVTVGGTYVFRDGNTMDITSIQRSTTSWTRAADTAPAVAGQPVDHAPVTAAKGRGVDPAVIGEWVCMTQAAEGITSIIKLTITGEGRYTQVDQGPVAAPIEQGHIEIANGTWLRQNDNGNAIQGSYQMIDKDHLMTRSSINMNWTRHIAGVPFDFAGLSSVSTDLSLNSPKSQRELPDDGQYAQALPPALERVENLKNQRLGPPDKRKEYATALERVGVLYEKLDEPNLAERVYREAWDVTGIVRMENNDNLWHRIGLYYLNIGDYSAAQESLEKARADFTAVFNESQQSNPQVNSGLGMFFSSAMGQQATDTLILKSARPDYLSDCGRLYQAIGDFEHAQSLAYQAAHDLENSTKLEAQSRHDFDTATQSFDQAVQAELIQHGGKGNQEPNYQMRAQLLNDIGAFHLDQGDLDNAQWLIQQGMDIRRQRYPALPEYADSLETMAALYAARGEYEKIEPLCIAALKIRRQTPGESGQSLAQSLVKMTRFYMLLGKPAMARDFCAESLGIYRRIVASSAGSQSERRQLRMQATDREALNLWLTLSQSTQVPPMQTYEPVFVWKGAVTLRQRQTRALKSAAPLQLLPEEVLPGDPPILRAPETVADASNRLGQLTATLAQAALSGTTPPANTENELESLQERLAITSEAHGPKLQLASLDQMSKAIPANAALVDIVQYGSYAVPPQHKGSLIREARFTAFVSRAGHEVQRVELGPAEDVDKLVSQWRSVRGGGAAGQQAGAQLRKRIWDPLTASLGDAKIILISPDGSLNQFPFAALPGKQEGHFLIEDDLTVAVLPVPQELPEIIGAPARVGDPQLLVVGDVDYKAAEPAAEPIALSPFQLMARSLGSVYQGCSEIGGLRQADTSPPTPVKEHDWLALDETGKETAAIQDIFKNSFPPAVVHSLSQSKASPDAFCSQAPACRYLHLATHGFFEPILIAPTDSNNSPEAQLRAKMAAMTPGQRAQFIQQYAREFALQKTGGSDSALKSIGVRVRLEELYHVHPSLQSGVVLAGGDRAGGILTAMQIEELNLENADLATLSACETGLGEVVQGDGVLGLQRAFQIAGARSVIASLWCVDSPATEMLMGLFYKNLWQKKMGKLEALRAAQLEMIKKGVVPHGQSRSAERMDAPEPDSNDPNQQPAYWAAFVLSGDWR